MVCSGRRRMKLRPAVQLAKQSRAVATVAFSASSRSAIALGACGSVSCWDVQTHTATACVGGAAPFAHALCVLPLGGVAKAGATDDSYSEEIERVAHPVLLASVGLSGAVDLLSITTADGCAVPHSVGLHAETDAVLHRAALGALGSVSALAFSPEAELLVCMAFRAALTSVHRAYRTRWCVRACDVRVAWACTSSPLPTRPSRSSSGK